MMMKDDKRKMATIIVSKMRNGDESRKEAPESEGAEMSESEDLYMVADEVLEALRQSDVRALKEALESFVQMCSNKEYKSED